MLGNCLERLKDIPDKTVQTCVTSPPYYGLRSYCEDDCIEKQYEIGLEETPNEYVAKMVLVFREVRRVLRDDGTCWLNLGDSYTGGYTGRNDTNNKYDSNVLRRGATPGIETASRSRPVPHGLKPKDLIGIPWRVAFALQADGWYLRQDIIWNKPNPMPESVTDRCTKAHEYIFLLSKSQKYFYDNEAIKEDSVDLKGSAKRYNAPFFIGDKHESGGYSANGAKHTAGIKQFDGKRNKRSVWTVATKPFKEAHFAVFPEALIEPCILAGTSHKACEICLAPWERILEKKPSISRQSPGYTKNCKVRNDGDRPGSYVDAVFKTVGWKPICNCDNQGEGKCIILDPFLGSGTTGVVSIKHKRSFIGIELNKEYLAIAKKRIKREKDLNKMKLF